MVAGEVQDGGNAGEAGNGEAGNVDPGSSEGTIMAAMAADPLPVYRIMRETLPAVEIIPTGVGPMGIVCHRQDIEEALRHPETFASTEAVDLGNIRPLIPLSIDPPEHKRYRRILDPLFSPRSMAALEEPVTRLANRLIDEMGDATEIDFAARFSVPFPSEVFLTLLGLPVEERPRFLAMKDGIIRPGHVVGGVPGEPAVQEHQRRTADSIYAYFEQVLDERTAEPREDILTRLLGSGMTREEILDTCFLLLIAGLDTVTASLDCMIAHLARHPDTRRLVAEDPERIPSVVEELLRVETPVMAVPRITTGDIELGGCPVPAGQVVSLMLGSANSEGYDDADISFDREEQRHLAFGGGVHRCLGSHLARMELRVALREWHRRYPDYAIPDGVELHFTPGIRSVEHFPLLLGNP